MAASGKKEILLASDFFLKNPKKYLMNISDMEMDSGMFF
jgi:hypothetical protein